MLPQFRVRRNEGSELFRRRHKLLGRSFKYAAQKQPRKAFLRDFEVDFQMKHAEWCLRDTVWQLKARDANGNQVGKVP